MRQRIAQAPGYDGEAANIEEYIAVDKLMKAWQGGRPVGALADAKPLMDAHPQWIGLQRFVADGFDAILRDGRDTQMVAIAKKNEPIYRAAYEGLIRSVLESGDGNTCASGYWVISTREEYEVLRYLKLEPTAQALIDAPGTHCDLMTAHDAQKHERKIFFDISSYYGKP